MVLLVFREAGGDRPLVIGMGPHDAWKIMGILEEKALRARSPDAPPEALSFALFVHQLLRTVGTSVEQVLVTGYDNHMWKSTVTLQTPAGRQELVCRASDGVAAYQPMLRAMFSAVRRPLRTSVLILVLQNADHSSIHSRNCA